MVARTRQRHYIQAPAKIKASGTTRSITESPHGGWASRRIGRAAVLAMAVLTGCAGPRLESLTGPPSSEIVLAEAGIRMTVLPNAWSGFPADLASYITPLAIRIENQRSEEVQVRYEDFVALDDDRNQFRALPPSEVARILTGSRRFERRPGEVASLLLAVGPWPWYPYRDPFLSPYYPYGYYGPYYPYGWPRLAQDILTLGLREGRILPGASVQGFVYLQLATTRGNFLTLSWTARDAEGISLATLSGQFRIVR